MKDFNFEKFMDSYVSKTATNNWRKLHGYPLRRGLCNRRFKKNRAQAKKAAYAWRQRRRQNPSVLVKKALPTRTYVRKRNKNFILLRSQLIRKTPLFALISAISSIAFLFFVAFAVTLNNIH